MLGRQALPSMTSSAPIAWSAANFIMQDVDFCTGDWPFHHKRCLFCRRGMSQTMMSSCAGSRRLSHTQLSSESQVCTHAHQRLVQLPSTVCHKLANKVQL